VRITRLSPLALLLLIAGCATAPPPRSTAQAVTPEPTPTAEARDSAARPFSLFPQLTSDARQLATAPLRWGRSDWTKLGLGLAAVGGAMLLDDEFRRVVDRNSSGTTRRLAAAVGPFGAEYSYGVLSAFYLAGRFLDDEKARAVAEDGLASSLIAAGAVTPILKLTFGRRRPSNAERRFDPGGREASFPSGHATQAFAVASVVASHYDSPWVRAAAYGLVGLSRMERDVHFGSDVLAGALVGIVVGKAIVELHDAERLTISVAPSLDPRSPGAALTIRMRLSDVPGVFGKD
jgi:membrane-associated phospholipid phosphatase